jgi:hypothetical protein
VMRTPIILALGAAAAAGALVWAGLSGPAGAGPAGAASPARTAQPLTVYAASGSGTVTPIRAGTNRALKAIRVGRLLSRSRSLRTVRPLTSSMRPPAR